MLIDFQAAVYINEIIGLCDAEGSEPLQALLDHVAHTFEVLSPDQLTSHIHVAVRLDQTCEPFGGPGGQRATSIDSLGSLLGTQQPILIEVDPSGGVDYWVAPPSTNYGGRLVYLYRGPADESFFVAGKEVKVPPMSGQLSRYAVPYFRDLESALENYYLKAAKFCQCPILARAWRDDTRLIFAPKPEHHMRDSLVFALRNTLRGYSVLEVMPEQNVNATRPVDVKVRWSVGRQVALIEIKWLGKSAALGKTSWGSQYNDDRGREGLEQLVDYLDLYHAESPDLDARGYVVVFDGRRHGLKVGGGCISRQDAYHYRGATINYQTDLLARSDVASPMRFFLEPGSSGLIP